MHTHILSKHSIDFLQWHQDNSTGKVVFSTNYIGTSFLHVDTHIQEEIQPLPNAPKIINSNGSLNHRPKPNNYHNKTCRGNHKKNVFAALEYQL